MALIDGRKEEIKDLGRLIEEAMNSDDEIDRTYLLEAIVADLNLIYADHKTSHVKDLIDNPIS